MLINQIIVERGFIPVIRSAQHGLRTLVFRPYISEDNNLYIYEICFRSCLEIKSVYD